MEALLLLQKTFLEGNARMVNSAFDMNNAYDS